MKNFIFIGMFALIIGIIGGFLGNYFFRTHSKTLSSLEEKSRLPAQVGVGEFIYEGALSEASAQRAMQSYCDPDKAFSIAVAKVGITAPSTYYFYSCIRRGDR